ncbi:MAG TPA: oligosaccharide flippase family protein, partial [Candidatus Saccharimonadales bacterium]|nr:oligosaccharide flippase family protein [Candidatus Saccharimonadales bacterium]
AVVFIAVSTRLLTLREMAVFALYNSMCALQAVICSMGLLTTATRNLPALMGRDDEDGAARLLRSAMTINAMISAVVASVLAVAARPLSLYFLGDPSYAPALRWAALAVFAWNLFEANQIFLVSLQKFADYARATVTCAVAQRILSLGLFLALRKTDYALVGYLAGFAAGSVIGLVRGFRPVRELASRPVGFEPLGALLRYSLPFYGDGYLRYLYMQADQLIIAVFLPPEVLALYFVAKRFIQYYQQAVASVIDPLLAKVGELRARGSVAVEGSLRSASRYFELIFLPMAAGTAAMSALLLDAAGGERYLGATPVLALLSLSVALYAGFNLVTGYVYMLGVPSDRLRYNMVTGISQAVLMALLLGLATLLGAPPLMAATGIALARLGSLLTGLLFAHRQLHRYITPAYDAATLPRVLAASGLLFAAAGIPQLFFYGPALATACGAAGAGLFVLAIRPAIRGEDFDLLAEVLHGRMAWMQRLARRVLGG